MLLLLLRMNGVLRWLLRGSGCWTPVPLPSILEPVADLSHGQPRLSRQRLLLLRSGVAATLVAPFQRVPPLFLEAVDRLVPVPNGLRQRVFPTDTIFVYCSQWSVPRALQFGVMSVVPQLLQRSMVLGREGPALEDGVQLGEISLVQSGRCSGLEQLFAVSQQFLGRQRAQKLSETNDVTASLYDLAETIDLIWAEGEGQPLARGRRRCGCRRHKGRGGR